MLTESVGWKSGQTQQGGLLSALCSPGPRLRGSRGWDHSGSQLRAHAPWSIVPVALPGWWHWLFTVSSAGTLGWSTLLVPSSWALDSPHSVAASGLLPDGWPQVAERMPHRFLWPSLERYTMSQTCLDSKGKGYDKLHLLVLLQKSTWTGDITAVFGWGFQWC